MAWTISIKLPVARLLFEQVGVEITENEALEIYECTGDITGQHRTLTGLCMAITRALKENRTTL